MYDAIESTTSSSLGFANPPHGQGTLAQKPSPLQLELDQLERAHTDLYECLRMLQERLSSVSNSSPTEQSTIQNEAQPPRSHVVMSLAQARLRVTNMQKLVDGILSELEV